ncbi:MAG: alpha/beta fold hydrolase [Cyanobacteria bacterium RI_101]|nr:alpha/beta fold hydrolase [Cyanobacteria bacterium RI_101]
MTLPADTLWLNFSPALRRFDRPLLKKLSQERAILEWDYTHTPDEPNSLEGALNLLGEYLRDCPHPLHLIGHSTSGLLALLYARQYPSRVKSLTLLSVGVYPALDWQAHYYAQANLLNCSRYFLLSQIANNLVNCHCLSQTQAMVEILEEDLITSLSPHSLYRQLIILPNHVPVPLLVATGQEDVVVDPALFSGWRRWQKDRDRLWLCPGGKYFFHYDYPEMTARQLREFWAGVESESQFSPLQVGA